MTHALTLRLQATLDLFKRYAAIFSQVWKIRRELDPPHRLPHEAQFLPAALELQETPVSPAPRIVAWLLMASRSSRCSGPSLVVSTWSPRRRARSCPTRAAS